MAVARCRCLCLTLPLLLLRWPGLLVAAEQVALVEVLVEQRPGVSAVLQGEVVEPSKGSGSSENRDEERGELEGDLVLVRDEETQVSGGNDEDDTKNQEPWIGVVPVEMDDSKASTGNQESFADAVVNKMKRALVLGASALIILALNQNTVSEMDLSQVLSKPIIVIQTSENVTKLIGALLSFRTDFLFGFADVERPAAIATGQLDTRGPRNRSCFLIFLIFIVFIVFIMSSPRLGVVRESMLTNPLHIKAPLGQSRSRGLTVPGPDFTFGTSSSSLKDGGVAEVLSSWKVPSRPEGSATRLDFVSLNRDAIRSGLVTSKEISQYRAQRGGASTQSPAPRRSEGGASRRPAPIPDITYGVQNRPSSPLSDLITHQYGRSWLDEQLNRKQNIITHQVKPGGAAETRTSLLRRSRALPVTHSPVQLSHFTQVSPALDTFRDPAARLRTFRLSGGTGGPAERQGTDRTERRTAEHK